MISAPCKDCTERHDLCHSNCAAYISYKQKLEAIHAEERRLRGLERPLKRHINNSIWRDE